jgi:hypothetical protein
MYSISHPSLRNLEIAFAICKTSKENYRTINHQQVTRLRQGLRLR